MAQGPSTAPPRVSMRWTVVTPDSTPLPRRSMTLSFNSGMSLAEAPGARPATGEVKKFHHFKAVVLAFG